MNISSENIFLLCMIGATSLVAFILVQWLLTKGEPNLRDRLTGPDPKAKGAANPNGGQDVKGFIKRVSSAVAKPLEPQKPEERATLRRQLGFAGFYAPGATPAFVASKILCLCLGALAGYLVVYFHLVHKINPYIFLAMGGIAGYLLPALWLDQMISRRRKTLERALPDALDLMVVCVEAGLTVDAAIQRVSREMAESQPEISRELDIVHLETRMGLPRSEALRNLGRRTGSLALQGLAAMLVQAEEFGTSIATALRVQSQGLRIKRQHLAEENAAKAAVKLAFPVALLIFPAIVVVIGGPAMITLYHSPLFKK
jgi:tight adherence protein C